MECAQNSEESSQWERLTALKRIAGNRKMRFSQRLFIKGGHEVTMRFALRFAMVLFSLASVTGHATIAFAQTYTTNGNGGPTDVGAWYEELYPLNNPSIVYYGKNGDPDAGDWNPNGFGLNDLPLVPLATNEYTATVDGWTFTGDGEPPSAAPFPDGIFRSGSAASIPGKL